MPKSTGPDAEEGFDPRWLKAQISKPDWHFHRQLLKRYGVVLGPGQFSQIIKTIRYGQARLVEVRGERGRIYSIRIKGAGRRVYVLAVDGFPRTAWPPEQIERWMKKVADSMNTSAKHGVEEKSGTTDLVQCDQEAN
jgi:hypothetical protein